MTAAQYGLKFQKHSKRKKIWEALQRGEALQMPFAKDHEIFSVKSLTAYMTYFRERGVPIQARPVRLPGGEFTMRYWLQGAAFDRYWMPQ